MKENKKVKAVKAWGFKNIVTNELEVEFIFSEKIRAKKSLAWNSDCKIVRVEIREIK